MGVISTTGRLAALLVALLGLAACAAGTPSAVPVADAARAEAFAAVPGASGITKIQHIVIIVQENRSFDNLFQGAPNADTRSWGYDSKGDKIALRPLSMKTIWDVNHSFGAFLTSCNGTGKYPGTDCRMNGFDREGVECDGPGEQRCPIKDPMYSYVTHGETKPYFDMAAQYVLADRMFVSNIDESSFVSHQYLIAAQASSSINVPQGGPWGCAGRALVFTLTQQRAEGPSVPACFDSQTLGDELDEAKISWKYYTASLGEGDGGLWSAYQAIDHIYKGPDWKNDVIHPQTRFFKDVRNGQLPAVSWVTPTCRNSDHAGCNADDGPKWVAALVNAVGESKYWDTSALFVFWDDPGGWYDHVAPKKLDYDGLGFRVPLLVISPYAKRGRVSHVRYEHGSLLRFVEDRFGLATLSASDARATSPAADCFNFLGAPRKFVPISTTMSARDFEREPLDPRPVDTE
ncbi:MAG TPA: alkaline phosphatase family protein [Candidatus Cybelea sp.]|nr:alkaline phosphatase family protein [Candidatus Cybelea sp.]